LALDDIILADAAVAMMPQLVAAPLTLCSCVTNDEIGTLKPMTAGNS
jgi:hypothetical protein